MRKLKLFSILVMALSLAACSSEPPAPGPAERAGKKIDAAVEKAGDKAHDAKENVKGHIRDAGAPPEEN